MILKQDLNVIMSNKKQTFSARNKSVQPCILETTNFFVNYIFYLTGNRIPA